MKKPWAILPVFFLLHTAVQAQTQSASENLVYNASYEAYTECPKKIESVGVLTSVEAWYQPTGGSADYFNRCGKRECSVPNNKLGQQEAHSGDGYCGIYCSKNEYREYLQTQLKRPLTKGKRYRLSFYASLSEYSSAAIATLGGLFTKDMVTDSTRSILIQKEKKTMADGVIQVVSKYYHAQVENAYNRRLDSTDRWQRIDGIFVAEGGERFLTIGNFNAATHSNITYPDSITYILPGAYYYIDDVEVTCLDCDSSQAEMPQTIVTEKIQKGSTLILKNLYFEFDKSVILQQSYNELEELRTLLTDRPKMKIEIHGHTDSQGNAGYNKKLSENRAKAVAQYLIAHGIDPKRLRYKGHGEEMPIDSNDTEEGRSNNRRVEIEILSE